MTSRFSPTLVISALAAVLAGCRPAPALRSEPAPAAAPAPTREEQFARAYVQALRDSGVTAILPRTYPSTAALRGFAPNMTILREALASVHATMTLARWRPVPGGPGLDPSTEIVYAVRGAGGPSAIGLFVQQYQGRLVVNTVNVGPPNPGPDPR